MKTLPRSVFISHGGGPLPLLDDPQHAELVTALKELAASIPRPEAIVVVSAHWECDAPTLTASANPSLIYDYYGFPPESYDIQYPCNGQPELAHEIFQRLRNSGIESQMDESRGVDHGVFVPLKIMYPEADIPCVQLSLVKSLDPLEHIKIGTALQGLHEQGVLTIGSGFSFHNLRAFFSASTDETTQQNRAFEAWLTDVCTNSEYAESVRAALLSEWDSAPGARYCHPREEHLLPLHVCYGASQSACSTITHMTIMSKQCSLYVW